MDATPYFGFYTRGPLSWQQYDGGNYEWDVDANAQRLDSALKAMQDSIAALSVGVLPPGSIVDCGTTP